jgi:uncharacterized DUF497 family protein
MMSDAQVVWDDPDEPDSNAAHVAEHGLTLEEVDEILLDDSIPVAMSRSTGRPCKFGWTTTGKHILVVWDEHHDDPTMVDPVTADEVNPPR